MFRNARTVVKMSSVVSHLLVLVLFSAFCAVVADTCGQTDSLPDSSTECCGLDEADDHLEISGNAALNQFPWLALIEHKEGRITCTGVLISARHVLTAAQCLYHAPGFIGMPNFCSIGPQPMLEKWVMEPEGYRNTAKKNVRLGEFNKTHSGPDCLNIKGKQVCNVGAITIPIGKAIAHPEFSPPNFHGHDIAIIELAERVPFNEFIRPICLPSSDITVSPPNGLRLVNAGWGSGPTSTQEDDVVKHYVQLPYVPLKRCKEIYESKLNKFSSKIGDSHICAGGEKGLDSCRGDGGGPLMSEQEGRYTLQGIVSFGPVPCGREGVPSVYTNVYSYVPWIKSITAS